MAEEQHASGAQCGQVAYDEGLSADHDLVSDGDGAGVDLHGDDDAFHRLASSVGSGSVSGAG
ncbi:hypothetical protein CAG99_21915 [Streptomyces marincola]|uniref:Uncharacterized protein n=1 Tax=Streptomyces marincola TaxID=2878388 RepID=A0A1W7D217_9ACTN|nr:hypothetical protein CAG99_21915 [Streptomyces marincola]